MAEDRQQPLPRGRTIIPVHSQAFQTWLDQASKATVFEHRLLEGIPYEDLAHAARMADAAITPWLTGAGHVAAVADPEAFKKSVLRKVIGVAESIRLLSLTMLRICGDALRGLEEAVAQGKPIEPGKELLDKVQECAKASLHADNALLALLIVTNRIDGIVQASLPPELQPTTTQAPMGFVLGGK